MPRNTTLKAADPEGPLHRHTDLLRTSTLCLKVRMAFIIRFPPAEARQVRDASLVGENIIAKVIGDMQKHHHGISNTTRGAKVTTSGPVNTGFLGSYQLRPSLHSVFLLNFGLVVVASSTVVIATFLLAASFALPFPFSFSLSSPIPLLLISLHF